MARLAILLGLMLALVLPLQTAHAQQHVLLLRADPPDGALLGQAPRELRLWFGEQIRPGGVELRDSQGRAVPLAAPRLESYQPANVGLGDFFDPAFLFVCQLNPGRLPDALVIALPRLDPGTYQLRWIASPLPGGSEASGSLAFRVSADVAEQPVATAPQPISQQAGDLLVTLTVSPNLPGQNFVLINVASTRRPAPAPVRRVMLEARPAGWWSAPLRREATRIGGGYEVDGDLLGQPGAWDLRVLVERDGMPETAARFDWTLASAGEPAERIPPWATTAALLTLASTITLWRRRRTATRPTPVGGRLRPPTLTTRKP